MYKLSVLDHNQQCNAEISSQNLVNWNYSTYSVLHLTNGLQGQQGYNHMQCTHKISHTHKMGQA